MTILLSISLFLLTALACWFGLLLIALSQRRNWRTLGLDGAGMRIARPLGWALLVAAFGLSWLRDGMSFAMLIWPMLIALSAISIALLLAHRPSILRVFAKMIQTQPDNRSLGSPN
ncbi:MAG: DUF3325 family protein [Pseudomonadota bacterium]